MIDSRTAPYAALVLRVALGVMFMAHALLKYYVFTLPGTAQFFQSLGLPGSFSYATFSAQLVRRALLLAGLSSPSRAAAPIRFLLGAAWAQSGNGWVFTAQNGGWEYPAFLAIAAAVQVLLGDGKYALAELFGRVPVVRAA